MGKQRLVGRYNVLTGGDGLGDNFLCDGGPADEFDDYLHVFAGNGGIEVRAEEFFVQPQFPGVSEIDIDDCPQRH